MIPVRKPIQVLKWGALEDMYLGTPTPSVYRFYLNALIGVRLENDKRPSY